MVIANFRLSKDHFQITEVFSQAAIQIGVQGGDIGDSVTPRNQIVIWLVAVIAGCVAGISMIGQARQEN